MCKGGQFTGQENKEQFFCLTKKVRVGSVAWDEVVCGHEKQGKNVRFL